MSGSSQSLVSRKADLWYPSVLVYLKYFEPSPRRVGGRAPLPRGVGALLVLGRFPRACLLGGGEGGLSNGQRARTVFSPRCVQALRRKGAGEERREGSPRVGSPGRVV